MTTVTFYDGDPYHMTISGHAGATQTGIDPVCAGASMLAWTLVEAATDTPDYHARLLIDELTPVIDVRCEPDEGARRACAYLFKIIRGGLDILFEQFPEYITIQVKEARR